MKTKNKLFISFLALTISFTSCASYHAAPLSAPDIIQLTPRQEEVSIISQTFTKKDCRKFLDRDVLSKGYQPVQIYIHNNSDKYYAFSPNDITLPIVSPEEVAKKVHTSTFGRVAGYSAGAMVLWPFAIPAAIFVCPLVILPIAILPAVPAVVDGIKSSQANTALDHDFLAKAAHDQTIAPYSHFNALIFVRTKDYRDSYTLTLIDQSSQQPKTFDIVSRHS
jgi:hypothetical protein